MWGLESPVHLLIVGLVALLLFGNRLPQAMRGLGQGIREFKNGLNDIKQGVHEEIAQELRQEPTTQVLRSEVTSEVPKSA